MRQGERQEWRGSAINAAPVRSEAGESAAVKIPLISGFKSTLVRRYGVLFKEWYSETDGWELNSLIDFRKIVSGWLRSGSDRLRRVSDRLDRTQIESEKYARFWHLAPSDEADGDAIYSSAILAGLSKPEVFNIALTGPYGSGKSSVIKSFLKKHPQKVLQISLASFLSEEETQDIRHDAETAPAKVQSTDDAISRREVRQEIERSILQQMLYGADANKLPFSRFKRIQSPGKWTSKLIAIYIATALFSCWHMFQKRSDILSGEYFQHVALNNPTNLIHFFLGGSLVLLAIYRAYTASYGVSLKSVSLKDIEITPAAINHESILNRHLDEIIYFFQSTDYELVVIEDLDRFNDPEIFVTLREINRIVNENASIRRRRKIRFIYAIRDDIFKNTDRTKFFEFIIPVIPIINTSNSIDMFRKEGDRLSLISRLDSQFVREVTRYLSDFRLIKNVFNEYIIYSEKLNENEGKELNPNKLLAVLIYKNIFPRDFEMLHQNEGNFAKILNQKTKFIGKAEAQYKSEISEIEDDIEIALAQLPANIQELRNIYAAAIIDRLPNFVYQIGVDRSNYIHICELSRSDRFDDFVEASLIYCIDAQGGRPEASISGFQKEVDPVNSFEQRKKIIERKSNEYQSSALKKIKALRDKVSSVRNSKFSDLVRQNAREAEMHFEAFGESAQLARYLVFEGHLDDTYYQYTSLFHAGRLSPRDNAFLRQIRDRINPEPDFQIDNASEVIAEMREEDFSQNFVLNVAVVDCLLSDQSTHWKKIERLFDFISGNFESSTEFFKLYYSTGREVAELISGLTKVWPGFVSAAVKNVANAQHITNVIVHLPGDELKKLAAGNSKLSEFTAANLQKILALDSTLETSKLKLLGVKTTDLSSIEGHTSITRFLFDEGLYKLSVNNIDFIFRTLLDREAEIESLHKRHFTTILETADEALTSKIDSNFSDYFENVLSSLESNTQESLSAILAVTNRPELEIEAIREFLEQQSEVIPSLEEVPDRLHSMLFEISKIQATWENCVAFISGPTYDPYILTNFLNEEESAAALSKSPIPDSEEASALRQFLTENNGLNDDVYASYIRNLSSPVQSFPQEISWEKLQKLIDARKVFFTSGNLAFVTSDEKFHDLFIEKNIEHYLEIESECGHDDEVRERLLSRDISDDQKLRIIQLMDLNTLVNMPSRVATVAPILLRSEADLSHLEPNQALALITNAKPLQIQIALFNKLHKMFDGTQIREILGRLPAPFSDIKPGYQKARLDISAVNFDFVKWLKNRQIISSWSEEESFLYGDHIRINNKLS